MEACISFNTLCIWKRRKKKQEVQELIEFNALETVGESFYS